MTAVMFPEQRQVVAVVPFLDRRAVPAKLRYGPAPVQERPQLLTGFEIADIAVDEVEHVVQRNGQFFDARPLGQLDYGELLFSAFLDCAHALEEYNIFWFEDPIKMRSMSVLKEFTDHCPLTVSASETLGGVEIFTEMIGRRATNVVMIDLGFVGGFTAGRQICEMAEAAQLPVTLHDCTGPVVYAASVHLSQHAPNAIFQESVRAFYAGWYRDVVDALPSITNGMIKSSEGPGLGLSLRADVFTRPDVSVRTSSERDM